MKNFTHLRYEFQKWRNRINYINRYYTKTPLLELLQKNSDFLGYEVVQGERFFRGRIFNIDDVASTNDQYLKWLDTRETVFLGYDKKSSGAPPSKSAAEGRLNGSGISFLYTCKNITTVIYELRPTKNEKISIAEFVLKKNLVFADLTHINSRKIENQRLSDLVSLIAEEFSTPHYAGHNYAFTQYLAGQFMDMGFDGVIFTSSLDTTGENYVFFNPRDCEAINSQLYFVDDISIKYSALSRMDFQYLD